MIQNGQIGQCLDYENAPDNYVIRTCGNVKMLGLWPGQVNSRTNTKYVALREDKNVFDKAGKQIVLHNSLK